MQNPFVKLKNYRSDVTHPTENHATEVLAACLVLSANLRRGFIKFLFREALPFAAEELDLFTVTTQAPIGGYGTVDLLIENPKKNSIVVEVKIGAAEDGDQIRKYRQWLTETRAGGPHYIFSLVQTPDLDFHIQACKGDDRRTWRGLYDFFSGKFRESLNESTEVSLADELCDYLEVERIVNTWQPKQIADYAKGVAARKALETLFKQVKEKLTDNDPAYDTKIEMSDYGWPGMLISHSRWSSIFGRKGSLQKLYVPYEPKGVDGGEIDRFYFEISIWNKSQGNDWKLTKQMILPWVNQLKKNGFSFWVVLKGSRELETDLSKYDFPEAPKLVGAYSLEQDMAYIVQDEYLSMNASELVDLVFERILKHCEIISGLPRA